MSSGDPLEQGVRGVPVRSSLPRIPTPGPDRLVQIRPRQTRQGKRRIIFSSFYFVHSRSPARKDRPYLVLDPRVSSSQWSASSVCCCRDCWAPCTSWEFPSPRWLSHWGPLTHPSLGLSGGRVSGHNVLRLRHYRHHLQPSPVSSSPGSQHGGPHDRAGAAGGHC